MRSHQLWLYKSADFKTNFTVSLYTLPWFGHLMGQFGVVFKTQSNCEVQSAMTVQISWLQNKYYSFFGYSGLIWTFKDSQFSCEVQSSVSLDTVNGFEHSKSHFGTVFQGQFSCEGQSAVTVQISINESHWVLVSLNEFWWVSMSLGESLNESWWVSMSFG